MIRPIRDEAERGTCAVYEVQPLYFMFAPDALRKHAAHPRPAQSSPQVSRHAEASAQAPRATSFAHAIHRYAQAGAEPRVMRRRGSLRCAGDIAMSRCPTTTDRLDAAEQRCAPPDAHTLSAEGRSRHRRGHARTTPDAENQARMRSHGDAVAPFYA